MMRLLLILFLCVPSMAQDFYLNFEGIANGTQLSTAVLGSGGKSNQSAVTYAVTITGSATGCKVVDDTAHAGLLTPVTVNGIRYTNSSPTKALLCDSFTAGDIVEFNIGFAASRKASYGYSITLTNWGLTSVGNFYNPGGFESGGTYGVTSMIDDSPAHFQAETNSNVGAAVNVGNFTIWVTALWDSANNKYINAYYNQTNMVLIGYSTAATALNATVNSMTFGITGSHSFTANRNYYLNNLILYTNGVWPVWPGGNLQIPTNSTSTAVTAAISAASNGDMIALPATNQTWTFGVTLNKNNCILTSVLQNKWGTNQTVITADGVIDAFTVSGNLNTISNFQVLGDTANDEATGFVQSGAYNRYSHMYLRELDIAIYTQNFGLMDNCVVADNHFMARNIFGNGIFDTYFPLPWDSTNYFVYEDNQFYWTSAKNASGSQPWMSSQEAQAFVIRHNYIEYNKASTSIQPAVDYHGDHDPIATSDRRPGLGLQVYSNYWNDVIGTTISGSKFVDVRGGRSLIYSNRWVGSSFASGDGIVYREEHPEDVPDYRVNNSYVWENKHGATGTTAMPINDDVNLADGVDYFSSALSPLVQIPYPHPQRGEGAQAIGPAVPVFVGPGRATGVRVTQP